MIHKLLFVTLASVGLLSALALPGAAQAHEVRHEYRHPRSFRVYYSDPCRPGWICAGEYREHRAALRCADQYRCRGFLVSIR